MKPKAHLANDSDNDKLSSDFAESLFEIIDAAMNDFVLEYRIGRLKYKE